MTDTRTSRKIATAKLLMVKVMLSLWLALAFPMTAFSQTLPPFVPNDPYFNYNNTEILKNYPGQWYLQNQTPAAGINGVKGTGIDANLQGAWELGYTGKGVVIGIVDDGVEGTHEDIKANYNKDLSRNFSSNKTIADAAQAPIDNDDNHGQSVAGVAAARGGNGIGGTGAAPYATLAGLNPYGGKEKDASAKRELYVQAYYWQSGVDRGTGKMTSSPKIDIMNHSYGQLTPWHLVDDLHGADITTALNRTAANGIIHVWSAGNERGKANEDAAKDSVLNNRNVIPVAALGSDGKYSSYSNYGYDVFVAAPSSSSTGFEITTTDRTGEDLGYNRYSDDNPDGDKSDKFPDYSYTGTFGGTSSSAPLVSGILALGKQANTSLDVRMAKHLLVLTSTRVDTESKAWVQNGAGNWFNPNYGFGLINAGKFVEQAKTVMGVSAQTSVSSGTQTVNKPIEYYDGSEYKGTSAQFTFSTSNLPATLRNPLEGVEVTLNFTHSSRGNLTAGITSPYSTKSGLFYSTKDLDDNRKDKTSVTNFEWTFLTNAFWGEDPLGGQSKTSGLWTLFMGDEVSKTSLGTWNNYNLTLLMGELIFNKAGTTTQTEDMKARSITMSDQGSKFVNPAGLTLQVSEQIKVTNGELNINGHTKLARDDDDDNPEDGWFILDGGIVSGSGVIDAPWGFYHSSGTLKPGNSIGTLTINGDYHQDRQGTLSIEVASPTSNDLLSINGGAELNGILQTSWTGGYIPTVRTRFGAFLTASSGVTGQFTSLLTNITPTLLFKPRYDVPNQIYLVVERDYTNQSLVSSLSSNQQAVAQMLNSVGNTASGDLDTVLGRLDVLPTNGQVAAAMDQIAPRGDLAATVMTQNDARIQTANISGRLQDLRAGMQGLSLRGLNFTIEKNEDLNRYGRPTVLAFNGETILEGFRMAANENWGIFTTGNATAGRMKDSLPQSDGTFRNIGLTAGTDYRFTRNLIAGVMAGYNRTRSDLDTLGSTAAISSYTLGAYGTYYRKGFYVDGLVNYGWNNTDKDRRIVYTGVDRTATSDQAGKTWTFSGGAGYDYQWRDWIFTPKLTVDYIRLATDDYTESGADSLNLQVNGQNSKVFLGQIGGTATYVWKTDRATVLPRLWVMYGREFDPADSLATTARLAMGSSSFTVSSIPPDQNFLNLGAGVTATLPKGSSLYLNLAGQVGQSNYYAYNLSVGCRVPF